MLEIREYTRTEIATELGIAETVQNLRQCIINKLDRLCIGYSVSGRGTNAVFQITNIPDRFALFCITELGCGINTDFQKIREVFYFALNDELFLALPDTEKEQFLTEKNIRISRGTIKNYLSKLEDADFLGGGEYVYLAVSKDSEGKHTSTILTKERYNLGWQIYWSVREASNGDYIKAYDETYRFLGGHPLKRLVPQRNGIMYDKLETLQRIIEESYEKDLRKE